MTISTKTLEQIHRLSADALKRVAGGESSLEAAADMYCEYLPDKAPAVGQLMAGRLNSMVENYERICAEARENQAGWLEEELEKLLEGKNGQDRHETLVRMAQAMAAVSGTELPPLPDGPSGSSETELLRMISNLNDQCKLDASLLDTLADALDADETPESAATNIAATREQQHDLRVVLSMAAYLNAKNGVLEEIPPMMTMDEITVAVCAAVDVRQTAMQVASGEMDEERGLRVLQAIGRVAGYLISLLFAAFGAICLLSLLSLGKPVLVVLAFTVVYSLLWDETRNEFAEIGSKLGEASWKLIRIGAKHIRRGVERIRKAMQGTQESVGVRQRREIAADA